MAKSATFSIQRLQMFFFNFRHVFLRFLTFFNFHLNVYYIYAMELAAIPWTRVGFGGKLSENGEWGNKERKIEEREGREWEETWRKGSEEINGPTNPHRLKAK